MTPSVLRVRVPGRTEIAGNHVDHQGGVVIAAAVDAALEMTVRPREDLVVTCQSVGFEPFEVDLSDLEPRPEERQTSSALVRGIAAQAKDAGWTLRGFDASVTSSVPVGGGLSSSAAFEMAVAAAFKRLSGDLAEIDSKFTDEEIVELALMSQAAENGYFGKLCGLMDQLACALGGMVLLDFATPGVPAIKRLGTQFPWPELAMVLVDSGADHAQGAGDFASIPSDMAHGASFFGRKTLGEVQEAEFMARFAELRDACGDQVALRCLHYFDEVASVRERARALEEADLVAFLALTRASGESSAAHLQNVSAPGSSYQPAMVTLALCQHLMGVDGAARIHGGGFGGCVQVFLPRSSADDFVREVNKALGRNAAFSLSLDPEGLSARWL